MGLPRLCRHSITFSRHPDLRHSVGASGELGASIKVTWASRDSNSEPSAFEADASTIGLETHGALG